jgi:hypothetical protein
MKLQQNLLHMISTEASSLATHNTSLGLVTKRPKSSGVKAAKAAKRSNYAKSQAGLDDEPGVLPPGPM